MNIQQVFNVISSGRSLCVHACACMEAEGSELSWDNSGLKRLGTTARTLLSPDTLILQYVYFLAVDLLFYINSRGNTPRG